MPNSRCVAFLGDPFLRDRSGLNPAWSPCSQSWCPQNTTSLVLMGLAWPRDKGHVLVPPEGSFWRDLHFKEVHWKFSAVNFIRRGSAGRAGWAPHLRVPKCCPLTQLLGSTLQVSYLPLRLHSSPAPILCYKALLELFIYIFFPIIFPYFIVTFGGKVQPNFRLSTSLS